MTQIVSKKFKYVDVNDLKKVESLIFPVFSKDTKKNQIYWKEIHDLFLTAMRNVKLNWLRRNVFWIYVNRTISNGIKEGKTILEIESILRKFLRKHTNNGEEKRHIPFERAKMNFKNIKNYIMGEKILDLGAGDGLLAQEIKDNLDKEVILVDVMDYNYTNLPLILYKQGEKVPLDDECVDTTILYTVLHHANDPEYLLGEATRVTKQCLIIKEAYVDEESIRITNSFFDWFYNRVIGDEDINVPLNFLKVKEWEDLLNSYGFDVVETKYVEIDEPTVPEHHVFIIAEKSNFSTK